MLRLLAALVLAALPALVRGVRLDVQALGSFGFDCDIGGLPLAASGTTVAFGAPDNGAQTGSVLVFDCSVPSRCVPSAPLTVGQDPSYDVGALVVALSGPTLVAFSWTSKQYYFGQETQANPASRVSPLKGTVFSCPTPATCVQTSEFFVPPSQDASPELWYELVSAFDGDLLAVALQWTNASYSYLWSEVHIYSCSDQQGNGTSCAMGSSLSSGQANDGFGFGLAVDAASAAIYVGAPYGGNGAVYVFNCPSASTCALAHTMLPGTPAVSTFGLELHVQASRKTLFVGTQNSFVAYDCATPTTCVQGATLAVPESLYYSSIAASDDGLVALSVGSSSVDEVLTFVCRTAATCAQTSSVVPLPETFTQSPAELAIVGSYVYALVQTQTQLELYAFACASNGVCAVPVYTGVAPGQASSSTSIGVLNTTASVSPSADCFINVNYDTAVGYEVSASDCNWYCCRSRGVLSAQAGEGAGACTDGSGDVVASDLIYSAVAPQCYWSCYSAGDPTAPLTIHAHHVPVITSAPIASGTVAFDGASPQRHNYILDTSGAVPVFNSGYQISVLQSGALVYYTCIHLGVFEPESGACNVVRGSGQSSVIQQFSPSASKPESVSRVFYQAAAVDGAPQTCFALCYPQS